MQDRPTVDEAIEAVVECLAAEHVSAYQRRVAVNLLGIVRRELELGPELEAAARARLVALLGREGALDALTAELAARIRDGRIDRGDPQLVEHLVLSARDRLRVANPRYLDADVAR